MQNKKEKIRNKGKDQLNKWGKHLHQYQNAALPVFNPGGKRRYKALWVQQADKNGLNLGWEIKQ